MYYFQINPWSKDNISKHTSTLWEISSTESFAEGTIVEQATTDATTSLNAYTSNITVPKGKTYYVRATRMFAGLSAANHTLIPVPIIASNLDNVINNNIIHNDSVRVDTPFIYVNTEELKDPNRDYFTVSTSKFRCKQDGHHSTHWIITNKTGDVVFTALDSTDFKTSIQIEKIRDITNLSSFIIHAIHTSTNGIESNPGTFVIQNFGFNFEVKGLTEEVTPQQDLNLFITPAGSRDKYVTNVYLRHINDDDNVTKGMDITPPQGSDTIVVPGRELISGRKYYIDVFAYGSDGELSSRRLVLHTKRSSHDTSIITGDFEKKLQIYPGSQYSALQLPRSFTSYQLPSGKVFIASSVTGNASIYEVDVKYESTAEGPKITLDLDNRSIRSDIRLPTTRVTGDNSFFRIFNGNILIMDCGDVNSAGQTKPKFFKYLIDNNGVLQDPVSSTDESRSEEVKSLGFSNAITQVGPNLLWYIPTVTADSDKAIKSLNIETMAIEKVFSLDSTTLGENTFEQASNFGLIYNRSKQLMHLISDLGKEIVFDPIGKEVRQIRDVKFPEWVNCEIKCLELANGDYLVLNIKNIKENNSILYYNSETAEYTTLPFSPDGNHTYYGSVIPNSKNAFFINRTTRSGGIQEFTVTRVY